MKKTVICLLMLVWTGPVWAGEAETRQVVQDLFEAFNAHDVEGMMALYHPDVLKMNPENPDPSLGYETLKKSYGNLFQTLSNVHDELTRVVVDGDTAAVEFTATWDGANGAKGSLKIAAFLKVENGLIVEDFTYYDTRAFQPE